MLCKFSAMAFERATGHCALLQPAVTSNLPSYARWMQP